MANQQEKKLPLGAIAGISAAVIATAGAGTAWWISSSPDPSTPSPTTTTEAPVSEAPQKAPQPIQTASPTDKQEGQEVEIYWLKSEGNEIAISANSITVEAGKSQDVILKNAFQELLTGPKDASKHSSTIPQSTKLLNLEIRSNGVHVDLSEDFMFGGGTASMTGRLGQVIYTASSLDPNAKVWINVEGAPLEVLGGEGLIVDQPMTRRDFEENFSL